MIFKRSFESKNITRTLHVVSEQKTAIELKASNLEGDVLAWHDALYEGPIVADVSLGKLSVIRAEYFSRLGWGEFSEFKTLFEHRNNIIENFGQYNEIILWFDSTLNNQLQLLQIIHWFSQQALKHVVISLVSINRLVNIVGIVNFSDLSAPQFEKLFLKKAEITNTQMNIGVQSWSVFASTAPTNLLNHFPRDMSSMPYLKNALLRLVQQFPSQSNGLCKTEYLIIQVLKNGQSCIEQIYCDVQVKESIPFMSKAIFFTYLQNMLMAPKAMVEKRIIEYSEAFEVTEEASDQADVVVEEKFELALNSLAGQIENNWVDWIQINGIDRWLGGVHLHEGNLWRYNVDNRQLMRTYL